MRKTSPAIRLMALWKSAAYSLIVCCFFSKLQSDLLHSTASDDSNFPHTVVQKVVKRSEKFASSTDNQRLLNCGARRAALRPYFTKPKLDFA